MLTNAKYKKIGNVAYKAVKLYNEAISKGNLVISIKNVFTNKCVNCVYITRSLFCIFAVLSCIKVYKVVIYVFLGYSTLSRRR